MHVVRYRGFMLFYIRFVTDNLKFPCKNVLEV